jgi:tRNA modification GTPase
MLDAERGWEGDDAEILALCQGRATLVLVNKLDVGRKLTVKEAEELCPGRRVIGLSVKEGWGIEALEEAIAEMVYGGAGTGEYASVSNIRHLKALEAARENLKGALEAARKGFTLDVISTAVRASLNELGKITGEAVDEEVVEHIFHDFCVGK